MYMPMYCASFTIALLGATISIDQKSSMTRFYRTAEYDIFGMELLVQIQHSKSINAFPFPAYVIYMECTKSFTVYSAAIPPLLLY